MELIVLKMPPDRVALIAEALQRDIATGAPEDQVRELNQIQVWLSYRHDKWLARQSVARQAKPKPGRTARP